MTRSDRDVSLWVNTKTGEEEVRGRELGRSSSRTRVHSHPKSREPEPYQRCSACRWTEITVLRTPDFRYAVVSEGLSNMDGEVPYGRVFYEETGDDAVHRLYRVDRRGDGSEEAFLPTVARKALLEAAEVDKQIAESLRDRGFMR